MIPGSLQNPFKVAIVGDAGVGKSSYIEKQFSPDFNREYLQTAGYEVSSWSQDMSTGRVNLELWDVSGSQSKLRDRQAWLKDSDAAIIMVDLAQPITFHNALRWHGRLQNSSSVDYTPGIKMLISTFKEELLLANPSGLPIVVCTWKPVAKDRLLDIDPEALLWLGETENVQFYDLASDISRFDQPILSIIRKLIKNPDAIFWFPYTLTDDDVEISD